MSEITIFEAMIELLIDTATELGSIALYRDNTLIYAIDFGSELKHLKSLHPAVKIALEECDINVNDIDVVGCNIGPGSFTGIRIGVTTARTFSQLGNCSIYQATSLDILCQKVPFFSGLICPVIDGKKNRVYGGLYQFTHKNKLKQLTDYLDVFPEQLVSMINKYKTEFDKVLFLGTGQIQYEETLNRSLLKSYFSGPGFYYPEAKYIHYCRPKSRLMKKYEQIKPLYLRQSDAEEKSIVNK